MNENDVPSFLFLFVLLSFFFLCRCCTYICPLLLILAPTARLLHAYRLSSEEEEYTTDETSDEEEEGETTRPSSSSGRKSSKPPRRWQASEDRRLAESVKLHGEANWKAIASKVGSRNHVQCLQRWKKVRDTPGMFLASFWGGVTKSILFHTGCSMPLGILYFGRIIFWEIFFFSRSSLLQELQVLIFTIYQYLGVFLIPGTVALFLCGWCWCWLFPCGAFLALQHGTHGKRLEIKLMPADVYRWRALFWFGGASETRSCHASELFRSLRQDVRRGNW